MLYKSPVSCCSVGTFSTVRGKTKTNDLCKYKPEHDWRWRFTDVSLPDFFLTGGGVCTQAISCWRRCKAYNSLHLYEENLLRFSNSKHFFSQSSSSLFVLNFKKPSRDKIINKLAWREQECFLCIEEEFIGSDSSWSADYYISFTMFFSQIEISSNSSGNPGKRVKAH